MCRMLAYMGDPIEISSILFEPTHSLIKQSYQADEAEFTVNGDGFGLSWFAEHDEKPALFKTLSPAWNEPNLKDLSEKIKTHCLCAHIRAATSGHVSRSNSHPFRFQQYVMMHNGSICNFSFIKRGIREKLSNTIYNWIEGSTDTEHFFALVMNELLKVPEKKINSEIILGCINQAIKTVIALLEARGKQSHISLNTMMTDGQHLIATRFCNEIDKAPSLYYMTGQAYQCQQKEHLVKDSFPKKPRMIIVASECLSKNRNAWQKVPYNHSLIFSPKQKPIIAPIVID